MDTLDRGPRLFQSATIVAIGILAGRLLGFAKQVVLASKFGASREMDAFFLASLIPDLSYNVLVLGVISAGFIPVFTNYLSQMGEIEARALVNSTLTWLTIIFAILTVFFYLFAPALVDVLAPGFESDTSVLASRMIRILAPCLLFIGFSGLLHGILNSYKHFAAPSFVLFTTNLIVIIAVLCFSNRWGVYTAAIGVLAGFLAQTLIQLPWIKKKSFICFSMNFLHPGIKEIAKLMLPALALFFVSQVFLIAEKYFGSSLESGTISALNYAYRVAFLPVSVFAVALGTVLLPNLSRFVAENNLTAFARIIQRTIRSLSLLIVPSIIMLIVLREPVIQLLFQRGSFDLKATRLTVSALFFYSLGMPFAALYAVLLRGYYALKDTVTPLKILVISMFIYLLSSAVLVRFIGHRGLALSYSISFFFSSVLMMDGVGRRISGRRAGGFWGSFTKIVFAGVLMGIFLYAAGDLLNLRSCFSADKTLQLTFIGLNVFIGSLIFYICCRLLRVEELAIVGDLIRGRRR